MDDDDHLRKRQKLDNGDRNASRSPEKSASRRSISPPARKPKAALAQLVSEKPILVEPASSLSKAANSANLIPSPVQLIKITELPASSNVDTVSLRDILGDPLISACWLFNYLFDVDFIMSQFDEDVRDMVHVKLVHGSWKKEDSNKLHIDEATKRYSNVDTITAHMPEPYGTHHSKMIVLFRHDDQAQVNLLTANFVPGDWRMSQAVWRSPLLPLQTIRQGSISSSTPPLPPLGSGARFKRDLLAYFRGYTGCRELIAQLELYEFTTVRGALVASLPGRRKISNVTEESNLWGLPGLKRVFQTIPSNYASNAVETPKKDLESLFLPSEVPRRPAGPPQLIIQISSVATIGDKWPRNYLLPSLSAIYRPVGEPRTPPPQFSIVFPTADEVRRSIDGYDAGGSIHMRTQTSSQMKQLDYLRPMLCHWAGDQDAQPVDVEPIREAGRRRAAPHIKTYVRFSDSSMTKIDWAMMTSANLSNQAWGSEMKNGEWRICSYEIGIVVWPALWDDEAAGTEAEMVPVFKKNTPEASDGENRVARVGWRMPYDLPLVPYHDDEMPWCASAPCAEPDWMGRSWPGFGAG